MPLRQVRAQRAVVQKDFQKQRSVKQLANSGDQGRQGVVGGRVGVSVKASTVCVCLKARAARSWVAVAFKVRRL
jgi:hypothetical protein